MCEQTVEKPPTRLWRNGMDFVPKKTYPPDYSNVPSVRDWQMSPFSQERFDLDEIQRAEKKGVKGARELERLKALYLKPKKEPEKPKCPVCEEREAAERRKLEMSCEGSEYMYQPYGPAVVSSLSYSRPEMNKPRLYGYMGPSTFAGYRFKGSKVPCPRLEVTPATITKDAYIPYGPHGEFRMTPDMYIPMGPTLIKKK